MAEAKQGGISDNLYGFSTYPPALDTEPPPFSESEDEDDSIGGFTPDGKCTSFNDADRIAEPNAGDRYDNENGRPAHPKLDVPFNSSEKSQEMYNGGFTDFSTFPPSEESDWADWSSFSGPEISTTEVKQDEPSESHPTSVDDTRTFDKQYASIDDERMQQIINEDGHGDDLEVDTAKLQSSSGSKTSTESLKSDRDVENHKEESSSISCTKSIDTIEDKDNVSCNVVKKNEVNSRVINVEKNDKDLLNKYGTDNHESIPNGLDDEVEDEFGSFKESFFEPKSLDGAICNSDVNFEVNFDNQKVNVEDKFETVHESSDIATNSSVLDDHCIENINGTPGHFTMNTEDTGTNVCEAVGGSKIQENDNGDNFEVSNFKVTDNVFANNISENPQNTASAFSTGSDSFDDEEWASFETFNVKEEDEPVGSVDKIPIQTELTSDNKDVNNSSNNLDDNKTEKQDICNETRDNSEESWASFGGANWTKESESVPGETDETAIEEDDWASFATFDNSAQVSAPSPLSNEEKDTVEPPCPTLPKQTVSSNQEVLDESADEFDDWATFSSFDNTTNLTTRESQKALSTANQPEASTDSQKTPVAHTDNVPVAKDATFTSTASKRDASASKTIFSPLLSCFAMPDDVFSKENQFLRRKSQVLENVIGDKYLQGEQSIWLQLRNAADKEGTFKLVFLSSSGMKWMLSTISLAYENSVPRKEQIKSPGILTPQTLSPASSLGSFDLQEAPLEPVPVLLNDINPRSDLGRQTLLAQSQWKDDKLNPVRRVASSSSLKKDSESETASETNSLDLEFFSSGASSMAIGPSQLVKGEQAMSTFGMDLLEVNFGIQADPPSKDSEESTDDGVKGEGQAHEALSDSGLSLSSSQTSISGLKDVGISKDATDLINNLEDLTFVTSSVLMFPATLLQDRG